jgi:CRISPR/Cas system-associated exonuclease Cas4 (RecB family)
MFHTLEEGLTGSRTRAFFDLSEVEDGEDFFRRICEKLSGTEPEVSEETLRGHLKAIHRNTIGRYHSFQDVGDFARKSIEILHYVFEASTARLHPLFSPFSEAFGQVFQTISKSLMKDTRFTETASYFTLFRKYLSSRYVPFDGTPVKGLQVLGVLETRGLSFDRVFVLDMNEEAFPDTRKEDSLLPYRVREALGLPTYRDRDRLAAYTFESLRRGAKEVHLFSIENDEKEKSRFVEKILWEKQKKDRETGSGRYFTSVRYRLQLRNAGPKEVRKSPEMTGLLRNLSYSATSLDTYLGCPLQFYYQYVLRTGPKEEATESIERADIGKFVHLVLSRFFERKKGHPLQEKDIDPDEMEGLVEDFFSREYGNDPVGAAYLLKGQVQAHLKRFLRDYTLPLIREHAVTVLHVEHNIKVTKNSFSLIGRLDQVEKWGERIRIVDYKTSSNSDALRIRSGKLDLAERETWGEAIGSLQLPFYLLLYSTISGKRPEELDALFLLLGRARISKEIEVPLLEREENPQEAFQRLESVIFRLLGEIVDPEVPFEPTRDRKGLCPGCDFRYLCGTQWIR